MIKAAGNTRAHQQKCLAVQFCLFSVSGPVFLFPTSIVCHKSGKMGGGRRGGSVLLGWFARNRIPFTGTLKPPGLPAEATGGARESRAAPKPAPGGHTPERGPGMDSTTIDWGMFRNKGFGPSGHCDAVFMEEAGCHGNRQATGIRAAFHPLSLWIRSARQLLCEAPDVQLASSFCWRLELPFQGPDAIVLAPP